MMILLIGTLFLLEHVCFGKCTIHAMFIKHANASSHGQVLEQKQKEKCNSPYLWKCFDHMVLAT